MIDHSMKTAKGLVYGRTCIICFDGFFLVRLVDSSSKRGIWRTVGHSIVRFLLCDHPLRSTTELEGKQTDISDFVSYCQMDRYQKVIVFMGFDIWPLNVGSEEKIVREMAFHSELMCFDFFEICSYYRLLVGVGKRGGKRGDWM
jgi:hypothetical protein